MATPDTLSTFDPLLKEYYDAQTVNNQVYKNNPLFGMLPKKENWSGRNYPQPTIFGVNSGGSAAFTNAQTNANQIRSAEFLVTSAQQYGVGYMANELIFAADGDKGSFLEGITTVIDGVLMGVARNMSIDLYRDGSGQRGQISSGSNVATNTITLANIDEITNFEVGMVVRSSAQSDGTAIRTGTEVIAGIDRNLGTLTSTSVAWNTVISAIAASDFLYRDGDQTLACKGLKSWVVPSGTTPAALFGVTRTTDRVRLAGVAKDESALPIEEGLVDGINLLGREGGNPNYGFFNFNKYAQLEKALGAKTIYDRVQLDDAEVAFQGIKIIGPRGTMTMIPDQNALPTTCFALQLDTFKLVSRGKAPMILQYEGNRYLRVYNNDQIEVRCGAYYNLACAAPGWNANLTI
jgi:hypothetical protein